MTPPEPGRGSPEAVAGALADLHREHWGRLLALLVRRYRRLELAEDALADAFERAAGSWPDDGVPANPAAWLLTAARRRALDRLRTEATAARRLPLLAVEAELDQRSMRMMADAGDPITDERLRLILLCAHPALPREHAAALTLRLVVGVPTAEIARLFLASPTAMAARLTRARKRLAGESFTVPQPPLRQARVLGAAEVAYLIFTAGYLPGPSDAERRMAWAAEAIRLTGLIRTLLPHQAPEAGELDALRALMLLQHARRDARIRDGRLVLLAEQDRSRWHAAEIDEAIGLLTPLLDAPSSPWLLQALIAAEHAIAPEAADTDWSRISGWYAELQQLTGSPVVRLNRAVAVAESDGPLAGLAVLDGLELPGHRLPAVRADLLARAGATQAARQAYDQALSRCDNDIEAAALRKRRARLDDPDPGTGQAD